MNNKALFPIALFTALIFLIGTCANGQVSISVPGLYNTGVDNSGAVLPLHSLEQHYSVSGATSIAYVEPAVDYPPLGWAWLAAPPGSAWIGPNSTTNTASPDPVGVYHYTIQFDLSGYNPSDVRIAGSWMTDNTGELLLNGANTGFTTDPESYKHLSSFTLNSGFISGINSLEFRVLNEFVGPNPTGLCVANLTATLVPEPTLATLLVTAVVAAMSRKIVYQKKSATLALALIAGSNITSFAQSCVNPPSGIVSWWSGESSANDEQANNAGTLQGGTSFVGGIAGQAFSFDGMDDHVSIAASSSLDVGAGDGFTIEAWIQTTTTSSQQVIAEWNNGTGGVGVHFMHSIGVLGGAGSLFANIVDTSGGDHYFATAAGVLNTANFLHVALTYDKSNGIAIIYLNGAVSGSANIGVVTPQTTYDLYLGTRSSGGGVGSFFAGSMDEVSLYSRALSDTEILAIYSADTSGKCKSGPPVILSEPSSRTIVRGGSVNFNVAANGLDLTYQWSFNSNALANAINASLSMTNVQANQAGNYSVTVSNSLGFVSTSNAALAVIEACPWPSDALRSWWSGDAVGADWFGGNDLNLSGGLAFTNGKVSQAFYFDGTDDFASVPTGSTDIGSGDGFTVECWIKPNSTGFAQTLFEWNNGITDGVQLWTSIPALGGAGSLFANIKQTNGVSHSFVSPAGIMVTTNFQHIALTYNRTSGIAKIFRNGASVASQNIGVFRPQTTYAFYFGKRISSGGPTYFRGAMDEITLYRRALTDTEILGIYLADTNGKSCQPPEFVTQPAAKIISPGSNVAFTAAVRGSFPFTHQWRRNGNILPGETNLTLIVSNAQPSQAGSYALSVTNPISTAVSASVLLKVNVVTTKGNGLPLTNSIHAFGTAVTIQLQNAYTNGLIFYTLDGSQPTFAASQYAAPFVISNTVMLRALGYSADFFESGELDPITILLPPSYPLSISSGGGGTVSVNPAGSTFLSNTIVTLTATPNPGWTFLKWTGDAVGATDNTTVTMSRAKSAKAIFGTTLNTTAAGGGSVTLNPPGGTYAYGSIIQISATPNAGNQFALWGNAASGNVNPLNFFLTNANPTVSSLFASVPGGQTSLTIIPIGRGTVSASPRANTYTTGAGVTITATSDSGQTFLGWGGDASGAVNPLVTAVNSNRIIYANFTKRPSLAATASPNILFTEGVKLVVTGEPGDTYQLETSTNLVQWSTLTTLTNAYGTSEFTHTPATNAPRFFYRAKLLN